MKLKELFKNFVDFFEDMMFPEYSCFVCGRETCNLEYHICDDCKKNLPFIDGHVCSKCGQPILKGSAYCDNCRSREFVFDEARAVFEYNEQTKGTILGVKYRNEKYLAKFFAKFMFDTLENWGIDVDVVIPVPTTKTRLKERGYNQAELIANELAKLLEVPILANAVSKRENTQKQKELTFKERQENMKGVFSLDKRFILNFKNILIVDDVFTTGATVNELSKELRKGNPAKIYVVTTAKRLLK